MVPDDGGGASQSDTLIGAAAAADANASRNDTLTSDSRTRVRHAPSASDFLLMTKCMTKWIHSSLRLLPRQFRGCVGGAS